jgi:hypothetical protein
MLSGNTVDVVFEARGPLDFMADGKIGEALRGVPCDPVKLEEKFIVRGG